MNRLWVIVACAVVAHLADLPNARGERQRTDRWLVSTGLGTQFATSVIGIVGLRGEVAMSTHRLADDTQLRANFVFYAPVTDELFATRLRRQLVEANLNARWTPWRSAGGSVYLLAGLSLGTFDVRSTVTNPEGETSQQGRGMALGPQAGGGVELPLRYGTLYGEGRCVYYLAGGVGEFFGRGLGGPAVALTVGSRWYLLSR